MNLYEGGARIGAETEALPPPAHIDTPLAQAWLHLDQKGTTCRALAYLAGEILSAPFDRHVAQAGAIAREEAEHSGLA